MRSQHPVHDHPLCRCRLPLQRPPRPLDLEDQTTRTNYSLGYQIGGDFKRQGVEMDAEALVQGHPRMPCPAPSRRCPPPRCTATLMELKRKVVAKQTQAWRRKGTRVPGRGQSIPGGEPGGQGGRGHHRKRPAITGHHGGYRQQPGPGRTKSRCTNRGTFIDGKALRQFLQEE